MTVGRDRIVIIDDEPDIAELFCEGLEMAGFKTISFDDPTDALEYTSLNHLEISLALVDWWMPLMDGFKTMKFICDIDSEIKILLITAYDLTEEQLKLAQSIGYLKKPISIALLIETVKKKLV